MAVRYGSDNSVLKIALLEVWGMRCHWCHVPLQFENAEIDHLIPRSSSRSELGRARAVFHLPDTFDVDGVENLAPICSKPCNGPRGKGADIHWNNAAFASALATAGRRSAAVERGVEEFFSGNQMTRSFQVLASVQLTDVDMRSKFVSRATLLAQRAAKIAGVPLQYVLESSCSLPGNATSGSGHAWRLELTEYSRSARYAMEEVLACPMESLLSVLGTQLQYEIDQMVGEAAAEFEHEVDPGGFEHCRMIEISEPPTTVMTLSDLSISPRDDTFCALLEGRVDANTSASAVETSSNGDALDESTVQIWLSAEFSAGVVLGGGASVLDEPLELDLRADPYEAWIE